jgi:VanZ family protein
MASIPSTFLNPYQQSESRQAVMLKAWLPVLLFSSIFAFESTAAMGADHTSAPLHSLFASILGSVADQNWSMMHHFIRKLGHFSAYGMLSMICFRGFWITFRRSAIGIRSVSKMQWASHGFAVAATFLVASADEIHQTFLPNRTGTFADVLLDTSGAVTMQLALLVVLALTARHRGNQYRMAEYSGPAINGVLGLSN